MRLNMKEYYGHARPLAICIMSSAIQSQVAGPTMDSMLYATRKCLISGTQLTAPCDTVYQHLSQVC